MPRPNKFPESYYHPSLRLCSKQDLDPSFLPKSNFMPNSEPPSYNVPFRRFNPRRPRPSVASVADIFVTSLVMAGFCHEHSPHGRGLSTMSMAATEGNVARWRSVGVADNRLPLSRNRLGYLSSRAEREGMRSSRMQRMFSSTLPQALEDPNSADGDDIKAGLKDASVEEPFPRRLKEKEDTHWRLRGELDERSKPRYSRELDYPVSSPERYHPVHETASRASPASRITPPGRYQQRTPAWDTFNSMEKLYRDTLGRKMAPQGWRPALWTVTTGVHGYPIDSPDGSCDVDVLENPVVEEFVTALTDEAKSTQYLFSLYRRLPSPGVAQLSKRSRGVLLRRFANPPNRRWPDARRFMALLEDMIVADLPISRSLWTSAIHLTGRAGGRVFKRDLERAIGVWQQMERVAGIKSDGVVFSVLFDLAIRAGQFTVADRLIQEMESRGLSFDRFGKVSHMYYMGLLRDSDGIREAFQAFVASGGLVDTVVVNCLIASFIRAGDVRTAEQLYERMMDEQRKMKRKLDVGSRPKYHYPTLTSEFTVYRNKTKRLGQLLHLSASLKNVMPKHHRALQESLPITPDTRTFHILLSYHARTSGNLEGFISVLGDMEETVAIPPRGVVYFLLFEGFARFGGKKKQWSIDKLREAWQTFIRAVYDSKARYTECHNYQRPKLGWENPLVSSIKQEKEKGLDTPGLSYLSLPSAKPEPEKDNELSDGEQERERQEEANIEVEVEEDADMDTFDKHKHGDTDDIDMDDLFGSDYESDENMTSHSSQDDPEQKSELDKLEGQLENGIFFGRRIIISILRAFGTCSTSQELVEVWLKIESVWQPQKRRVSDVIAVREELQRQLARTSGEGWR